MYFELYDGEAFITFDIVYLDEKKMEVQLAVTNRGKISFAFNIENSSFIWHKTTLCVYWL